MNAEPPCDASVINSYPWDEELMMSVKKKPIRAVAYSIDMTAVRWLAALVFALALLAIPHLALL